MTHETECTEVGTLRVAAIGLDAMEWTLVEQLLDEGELPTLRALRDRAAWCRLENVLAYRSELPWTLFLTGRTPAANRYWGTTAFDPASYDVYTVGAHRAPPFYARHGAKAIVFDVPHSAPADDVDGIQVFAWGAHSAQYPRAAQPRGLLDEIDARFGPHPGFDNDYRGAWYIPRFLDELVAAQLEGASRRVDILQWLQERQPDWDLLLTAMSEPHSAGHHLWHGVAATHPLNGAATAEQARRGLLAVYKRVDEQIGRLLDGMPADTAVVVFALHGMQPNANDVPSMVLLPELLHRLHFGRALLAAPGRRRWRRSTMPTLQPDDRSAWATTIRRQFGSGLAAQSRRMAWGLVPEAVLEGPLRLRRRLLGKPEPRPPWEFRRIPPETDLTFDEIAAVRGSLGWQVPCWYRRTWPQMRWFALPTFSDGHVRVNLAGRERDGIVAAEDYRRACDELETTLRACRNPRTGNPAVADVVRIRADDPMASDGPDADLVVFWTEPMDALEHPDAGLIGPVAFNRVGEHSSNGFAMIAGPGIDPCDLGTRAAEDLTATVLGRLGWTPDPELAGRDLLVDMIRAQ